MPSKYGDDDYAEAQAIADPPVYYSGRVPGPYISGAIPVRPTSRLQSQPRSPYCLPPNHYTASLLPDDGRVSSYRDRPRSLPPMETCKRTCREVGDLSAFKYGGSPRDPVDKARHVIENTFSSSNSGLGVGVLGAIVGGLIAREASEATAHISRGHGHHGSDKAPLVSALVGAAVGGLAANALEKRIEVTRAKTAEDEDAWEEKWDRDSKGRRTGRNGVIEDFGRRETRRRASTMSYQDGADDEAVYYRSRR
ncbi:hypothetical protein VPNG_04760 [Cytospora leucostoma]|uniref:Glycine zipper 2TM domain-containing protein n=1 Tax=Cytospora leucostoma TaxID=1230097 RepID=A0A423XAQ6_9PEZI|nr:hypothetical protein VPNG_04760 [Cytospora leucostoma]